MKKALLISLSLSGFLTCTGQQQPLHSQYIFNLYMINPAYAGARKALSANVGYRAQWVGFDGAPTTRTFSVHSPIRKQSMSLGMMFQNETIGARETSHLSGAYAYRIKLSPKERLSFGLQAGAINYLYHWSKIDYERPGDPASYTMDRNVWLPSFDFGVLYTLDKGYVGFSATSLSRGRVNDLIVSDARLEPTWNFMAGKVFGVSEHFAIKPSLLARGLINGLAQFDINMSCLMQNALWLTTSYRYRYGMVFSAHYTVGQRMHIGYAYDAPFNTLRVAHVHSHEVFIGYDFNIYRQRSTPIKYF